MCGSPFLRYRIREYCVSYREKSPSGKDVQLAEK